MQVRKRAHKEQGARQAWHVEVFKPIQSGVRGVGKAVGGSGAEPTGPIKKGTDQTMSMRMGFIHHEVMRRAKKSFKRICSGMVTFLGTKEQPRSLSWGPRSNQGDRALMKTQLSNLQQGQQ
jgi:hypothetical protein